MLTPETTRTSAVFNEFGGVFLSSQRELARQDKEIIFKLNRQIVGGGAADKVMICPRNSSSNSLEMVCEALKKRRYFAQACTPFRRYFGSTVRLQGMEKEADLFSGNLPIGDDPIAGA